MSDVKLISPLLDGFSVGNPMSDHYGVKCYPAIKENTDKKYILKIISIPASQTQMDALLLAGAYKDPADVMEYFRQLGEDTLLEAERLKTLSKLDGFLAYEGWQMVPITRHRLGYEIYLLGSYKRSLEKYCRSQAVTHLEAINLGLDLCTALSIARESGAIYAALKPTNIFVSEKKEFRIGDLGFIPLDALSYSTLSEKQLSPYTPPELHDPMASLNLTMDTYAVGMILYRLYNDNKLPFKGKKAPDVELPSPLNADYELAEIIMKAIHPDPAQRWTDPGELGKALAAYMQKNSVNDVPITPYTPLDISSEGMAPLIQEQPADEADALPDSISEEISEQKPAEQETSESANEEEAPSPEEIQEAICEEASDEESASDESVPVDEPETEADMADKEPEETAAEDPAEEPEDEEALDGLSEDVSQIVKQADDLISHQIPEEILVSPAEPEEDPFAFAEEDAEEPEENADDDDLQPEDSAPEVQESISKKEKKKKRRSFADPKYHRRLRRTLTSIVVALSLCVVGMLGYAYYLNVYLQVIDGLHIEASQDQIHVQIQTEIDPAKLRITCTDAFGNAQSHSAASGEATFTDLKSNTLYTIALSTEGFHKLTGKTTEICTTAAQTEILDFSYMVGSEDGSVLLNFSTNGKEPDDWTVFYGADGVEEMRQTFTGHSVGITDLVIGKNYTFRLETGENITLGGKTTLDVLVSKMILAEDLRVDSHDGTEITVSWNVPGDVVVNSWTVKCYNGSNYDEQITVSEQSAVFTGIDPSRTYTIEVTASGMTQYAQTTVSANPITIGAVNTSVTPSNKLKITWDHSGTAPKDGWLLTYSYANGQKDAIKCTKASAEIPTLIPGAKYTLTIQAADGSTVYNSTHIYDAPAAEPFQKHSLAADQLTVSLLNKPEDKNWKFEEQPETALTNQFQSGSPIAIGLRSAESFHIPGAEVKVLYVIRDAYGNILPDLVTEETKIWKNIWDNGDIKAGELDIPALPAYPGDYVLNLYFDGMSVAELNFTIQ